MSTRSAIVPVWPHLRPSVLTDAMRAEIARSKKFANARTGASHIGPMVQFRWYRGSGCDPHGGVIATVSQEAAHEYAAAIQMEFRRVHGRQP